MVEAESGALLSSLAVRPRAEQLLRDGETLLAVTSPAELGLADFERHDTTHTPVKVARGLSLGRLPDRWQGLAGLDALVWTPDRGGDPADPLAVSGAQLGALREWVYRGGHLVVMLPQVGQTWTRSPLADLLPVRHRQLRPIQADNWWAYDAIAGLGKPTDDRPMTVSYTHLTLPTIYSV